VLLARATGKPLSDLLAGGRLHLAERLLADTSGARSTAAVRALEADVLPRLAANRDICSILPSC
jgi:hypothetical protein